MKSLSLAILAACVASAGCGGESPKPPSAAEGHAAALTARKELKPIPEPYRNIWAVNLADCPLIEGATRLSVDPASVSFPGARFDVVSLNEAIEGELLLDVRLGQGPVQTHILKIGMNAETLSYTSPGVMTTFKRCPF